jgi:hypothetical protein
LLSKARNELVAFENTHPGFDPERLKLAWKEIMISEGSDWCWWFGPHHEGPNNDDFDRLYRSHLANVYRLTDREPPAELFEPIRTGFINTNYSDPVDLISPVIDGKITHYYEWQQAGFYDCNRAGSTMHRAERLISGIWFGNDNSNLYMRIDPGAAVTAERFGSLVFEIEFYDASVFRILINPCEHKAFIVDRPDSQIKYEFAEILELLIPMKDLPQTSEKFLQTRLVIKEAGKQVETWPPVDFLKIKLPSQQEIPWTL